jgi:flavin reductase (DIM6/NTAB) family NADH-FMN oxidoreductase RutF
MSEIFGRLGGPRDEGEVAEEALDLGADARGTRWLRRHLAGGAAALTTLVEGSYRASTVTGLVVASLEPPLLLVSLEQDSQMEGWVRESGIFGVSILSGRQQFLADRFAGLAPLAPPTFQGIPHFTAVTGAPLLSDSLAWADCRVSGEFETGDHVCLLGTVVELGAGALDDVPLIYYQNRYLRPR